MFLLFFLLIAGVGGGEEEVGLALESRPPRASEDDGSMDGWMDGGGGSRRAIDPQ